MQKPADPESADTKEKRFKPEIAVKGETYLRIPIRTHIVTEKDDLLDIVKNYAIPKCVKGDVLLVGHKVAAAAQGRIVPIASFKPRWIARFITKFVWKPASKNLGTKPAWRMEIIIRQIGYPRFIAALMASVATKPFGVKGIFFKVIGRDATVIDGPVSYNLPPFNTSITLAPENPNGVAKSIKEKFGISAAIVDANDLGIDLLGKSDDSIDENWVREVFKDNPLGQAREQTPMCIVRKI